MGDPLVGGVGRDDGLVNALLAARRVVVAALEHVVAVPLVGRAAGPVVDLGSVGVLDAGASPGAGPVVDPDGVGQRPRVAEGELLAADAHGVQGGVEHLPRGGRDADVAGAVEAHAVGQRVDDGDAAHRGALVVHEQAVADGLVVGRVIHPYLGGIVAHSLRVVVVTIADLAVAGVLHDGVGVAPTPPAPPLGMTVRSLESPPTGTGAVVCSVTSAVVMCMLNDPAAPPGH